MSKAYMYAPKPLNRTLADLYRAGLQAAAPGPALSGVLDRQAAEAPKGRVWIAALGKAARPMAEAALEHLAKRGLAPAGGVVIVPDSGTEPVGDLPVVAGDHPLPGRASLEAAETLQALAGETGEGDEVWVLLSGGATSLAAAPVDGVDAGDLQTLYRSLLNSGLDIAQMNTVRKRFSRWGAGRLAVALHPARVRTFLISDVIGDDVAAIGSGPCVADPSRASEIRELLVARGLATLLPSGMDRYLRKVEQDPALETPKPDHPAFQGAEWHMVAGNRQSLDAIAARAEELGWRPKVLPDPFSGEAAGTGRRLAAMLLEQAPGTCLIAGGETVVKIDPGSSGKGGRSQELGLAAARELAGRPAALLAAGTDGRDGPTDAAGAMVNGATWGLISKAGRDPAQDLAGHNSYPALAAAGALLVTGLTGTNVMDVVVGVTPKASEDPPR